MRDSANRRRQTSICPDLRIALNPKSRKSKFGRRRDLASIPRLERPQNEPKVRRRASDVEGQGNKVRPRRWRQRRQLRAVNRMIEGIALNRGAADRAGQGVEVDARRK